ncbi:hypothetical protein ACHAPT_006474 [Fusarium lateritium]
MEESRSLGSESTLMLGERPTHSHIWTPAQPLSAGSSTPKTDQHGPSPGSPTFVREKLGFVTALTDFACVVCPLAFLIFAIFVLRKNGRPIDEDFSQYQNAITTLATIFPILFAAIMGRLMYQISRWKLERGGTVGTLEQLMGSRTLGSTILTQAELHTFNILGLALIFVWAWSPLGGQGLLRMMDSRLKPVVTRSEIIHFDTDSTPEFATWMQVSASNNAGIRDRISIQDSMYNAALLSPDSIQNASQDIWDNVKIPFLDSYAESGDSEWHQVPSSHVNFEYSALVGVPVTHVSTGNTTFSLESSYIYLDCTNITRKNVPDARSIAINDSALAGYGYMMDPPRVPNGTWQGHPLQGTENNTADIAAWNLALDTFVDPMWSDVSFFTSHGFESLDTNRPSMFLREKGIEGKPTKLLAQIEYRSDGNRPPDLIFAQCGVYQHYIESRVNCSLESRGTRQNCSVVEQRRSKKPHAPEDISLLSFQAVFNKISLLLPQATHHTSSISTLDPSLKYIQNPSSLDIGNPSTDFQLEKVPKELFSHRLGQLINSYILIGQVFPRILGGSIDPDAVFEPNITVPVDAENLVEVYRISAPWTGVCIVSCIVFLVGGILSVVFIRLAAGPDVLGFVSTAMRDSKWMEMSPETTRMNGMDWTRSMREQRIRYGFVHQTPEGESLLGVGREDMVKRVQK